MSDLQPYQPDPEILDDNSFNALRLKFAVGPIEAQTMGIYPQELLLGGRGYGKNEAGRKWTQEKRDQGLEVRHVTSMSLCGWISWNIWQGYSRFGMLYPDWHTLRQMADQLAGCNWDKAELVAKQTISRNLIVWHGWDRRELARAHLFTANQADRMRGHRFEAAWVLSGHADPNREAFCNLIIGLHSTTRTPKICSSFGMDAPVTELDFAHMQNLCRKRKALPNGNKLEAENP